MPLTDRKRAIYVALFFALFGTEDEIAEIARFYGMPLDSLIEFTTKPTYKVIGCQMI